MYKLLLFLALCTPIFLSAQMPYRTEIGVGIGIMSYQGDLEPKLVNPGFRNPGIALALNARRNVHNLAAIRLNLTGGILAGDDATFTDSPWRPQRGFSFNTPLIEGALHLEVYPFGMFKTTKGGKQEDGTREKRRVTSIRRMVAPFAAIGIGGVFTHTKPDFNIDNDGSNPIVTKSKIDADRAAQKPAIILGVPMGGGFRFRLTDRTTLGIEAYTRAVSSDYLDGVSLGGNPDRDDWFFTGMVSFSHAFGHGKPKKHQDVAGAHTNEAPKEKESKEKSITEKSAADRDKDGVTDDKDECPDEKGVRTLKGCPDSDRDGVADAKDECPEIAGKLDLAGCPDGDGDGIADKNDGCPTIPGVAAYRGCPAVDRDKDGIADAEDLCPDMPGELKWSGCADNDGDGIADNKDDCPGIPGSAATKGCPDGDGDGVADLNDACPTVPGIAAKKGCPEASAAPGIPVPYKALYFDTKLKDWYQTSYTTLEEVVQLLQDNPAVQIRIEGNTDNTGDNPANNLLSEQRAKQCYNYLASKGIVAKRMTFMGFADRRPVATNSTKEGRQLNRRVEIHFYQ